MRRNRRRAGSCGLSRSASRPSGLFYEEGALAEIDENLIRRDLTPAQRAKLVSKRKAAYEATHPETKHGAIGRGRGKSGQVGHSSDRFTTDTARRTGKPERTIRRDATRAEALGPDLDRVAGTSLDKGSELDALAAMPAPGRQCRAFRAGLIK
jgi:hypothetical protein